jgi:hypothetical protein
MLMLSHIQPKISHLREEGSIIGRFFSNFLLLEVSKRFYATLAKDPS